MNAVRYHVCFRFILVISLFLGMLSLNGSTARASPGATFTVNSTSDLDDANRGDGVCDANPPNNVCTLRSAIREANTLSGADTIILPGGIYVLTLVGSDDLGAVGDLDILDDLTINGAGASDTIIDGNGAVTGDRALDIPNFAVLVTLNGVTVENGKSPTGGGLHNEGNLTITNSIFTLNEAISASPAFVKGGAIISANTLIVSDTIFSLNKATATNQNAYGGAIYIENPYFASFTRVTFIDNQAKAGGANASSGGALYNWGKSTLKDCTFTSNETLRFDANTYGAEGGAILNNRQLTIEDSHLEDNSAQGSGGGISSSVELTIRSSTLLENTATDGAGMYLTESSDALLEAVTLQGNIAARKGGGIFSYGTSFIYGSTFEGNQAEYGAGLQNFGQFTIYGSSFQGNIASYPSGACGGGINNIGNAPVSIANSSLDGNQADSGGGIYHQSPYTMTLSYVTVYRNLSSGLGAGIYNQGPLVIRHTTISDNHTNTFGGGLFNNEVAHLTNTTLSGNLADQSGGGIENEYNGNLDLSNVTITLNKADNDANSSGDGGGIRTVGSVTLRNTVIAGNLDLSLMGVQPDDCSGVLDSDGNNLLGKNTGCTGMVNGHRNDQVGTSGSPINPLLNALAKNGGATKTHMPIASSTLIDNGNSSGCKDSYGNLLFLDQRNYWRPVDGNADAIKVCDIGAVEYLSFAARFLFAPLVLH